MIVSDRSCAPYLRTDWARRQSVFELALDRMRPLAYKVTAWRAISVADAH